MITVDEYVFCDTCLTPDPRIRLVGTSERWDFCCAGCIRCDDCPPGCSCDGCEILRRWAES